jgi:hypothetical protein
MSFQGFWLAEQHCIIDYFKNYWRCIDVISCFKFAILSLKF